MNRGGAEALALRAAKDRLDRLALYRAPVRIDRVRILSAPWLFRLPWFRRFSGYATYGLILLREPLDAASDDLVCHELCHVWQLQHLPLAMPLSYLAVGYADNPYEREARAAVAATGPHAPGGQQPRTSSASVAPEKANPGSGPPDSA